MWSDIVRSQAARDGFTSYLIKNNYLAALSQFTILELTRAKKHLKSLDSLFLELRDYIWVPTLYDQVLEQEVNNYPAGCHVQWMPLTLLIDENQRNVMSKFAHDKTLIETRDDFLKFGYDSFMNLELFKENFPPEDNNGGYSTFQAQEFAWQNVYEYLGRHFPWFLSRYWDKTGNLDTQYFPSVQIRALFLFYKYYIHGQSPERSDFFDFAHVSYSPYVDVFVTERNASNVLRHLKSRGHMLEDTEIVHVTEFIKSF
ncbi:MAG: hypothetical protein H6649_11305 [Caldilineae bacterium]|nr:hypothetical protein [Caldilineae bacterium]